MTTIAVLPGDGIGPAVITETMNILRTIAPNLEYVTVPVGLESLQAYGEALTHEHIEFCKSSDAILFGAVGDEKSHPSDSLGKLRQELDLYANLRPITFYSQSQCRMKDILPFDILMVRELSSGIYFSEQNKTEEIASDVMSYTRNEIERIAHVAFTSAQSRKNQVTSVDKANVLACSQLWRETVSALASRYSIALTHELVDAFSMKALITPHQFDVVLTANLFGDILSDTLSVLSGSIGLLPSASFNKEEGYALFEPVHGSAPELERHLPNPIGAILSGAMMLEYLGLDQEKKAVEKAVHQVVEEGYHTIDMKGDPEKRVTTQKMGKLIVKKITSN
ncbi:MAG: 3-isopropylmalate dehydrogenase [Candidatus Thorarchaeota archaeon]|jgi:3-isopropylmalate dehydrogenase